MCEMSRGEGLPSWEKLSPVSTGALWRQLRKQCKLRISRLCSHPVLILGCSKIRPVLWSLLQLPQEALAVPGMMIIHIRRGWRGSPKPQPTQWPVPRGKRSPSARPKHGQGGAAQMLLFRPHGGFFTQALRLFGKS